MKKTLKRGSALGALLLAWWGLKQGQGWPSLNALDVGILAGLALCWLLDRGKGGK